MRNTMTERCGGLRYARRKPDGGFCFIPAMAILRAWFAYRRAIIRLVDLRTWMACFELVARRYAASERRRPKYSHKEIHKLIGGVGGQHVRNSIRRLETAGLLTWSESRISLIGGIDAGDADDGREFATMCNQVENRRRKVPVPRRLVRHLARTSKPVLIATALGHALRCLYYRKGTCRPDGRCKSCWIASVFGVDQRNVKSARQELIGLAVMRASDDSQKAINRWGPRMIFILPKCMKRSTETPSLAAESKSGSPPLKNDRNLSSRSDHQKLRSEHSGVLKTEMRPPRFRNVLICDLREPQRLHVLFAESVKRGLCRDTQSCKLDFFGAAARAVRVGTQNPCGLFAAMVRKGLWKLIAAIDEDCGRVMLRTLDEFRPVAKHPSGGAAPV